jgi:hypothetical protein
VCGQCMTVVRQVCVCAVVRKLEASSSIICGKDTYPVKLTGKCEGSYHCPRQPPGCTYSCTTCCQSLATHLCLFLFGKHCAVTPIRRDAEHPVQYTANIHLKYIEYTEYAYLHCCGAAWPQPVLADACHVLQRVGPDARTGSHYCP